MKRLLLVLAVMGGLVAFEQTASAQHHGNKTMINNSGNGINNNIQVSIGRHHGFPGGGFPGGGFPGGGFPGGGFPGGGFPGGGFPGSFPGGIPGVGGININVITNSGNGVGNNIGLSNSTNAGGVNVNVITNSGNGIGNNIGVRNRR